MSLIEVKRNQKVAIECNYILTTIISEGVLLNFNWHWTTKAIVANKIRTLVVLAVNDVFFNKFLIY